MKACYYDLSGGINSELSKTQKGMHSKKVYWSDSCNVEIHQNSGVIRQNGNTLYAEMPEGKSVMGLFSHTNRGEEVLLAYTKDGELYYLRDKTSPKLVKDGLNSGIVPCFTKFLDGVVISGEGQRLLFFRADETDEELNECELKDENGKDITPTCTTMFSSRVWAAKGSTLYFSAIGKYDDWTSSDAGYISDFHVDTSKIVALKPYKSFLAIYKENSVYLLSGTTPDTFTIVPFSDKGVASANSVGNIDNKQFFFNGGVYALSETELAQVRVGSELSLNIKTLLNESYNKRQCNRVFVIPYLKRNQIWFFLPEEGSDYINKIWINDLVNKAWYKREVPQKVNCAALSGDNIVIGTEDGEILTEDLGESFNGEPVSFIWKSPYFSLNSPLERKTIEEFYLLVDDEFDNIFDFSVHKDGADGEGEDLESVSVDNLLDLKWDNDYKSWADEGLIRGVNWAQSSEYREKMEISNANYSVQIVVSGERLENFIALLGLEFEDFYF